MRNAIASCRLRSLLSYDHVTLRQAGFRDRRLVCRMHLNEDIRAVVSCWQVGCWTALFRIQDLDVTRLCILIASVRMESSLRAVLQSHSWQCGLTPAVVYVGHRISTQESMVSIPLDATRHSLQHLNIVGRLRVCCSVLEDCLAMRWSGARGASWMCTRLGSTLADLQASIERGCHTATELKTSADQTKKNRIFKP